MSPALPKACPRASASSNTWLVPWACGSTGGKAGVSTLQRIHFTSLRIEMESHAANRQVARCSAHQEWGSQVRGVSQQRDAPAAPHLQDPAPFPLKHAGRSALVPPPAYSTAPGARPIQHCSSPSSPPHLAGLGLAVKLGMLSKSQRVRIQNQAAHLCNTAFWTCLSSTLSLHALRSKLCRQQGLACCLPTCGHQSP